MYNINKTFYWFYNVNKAQSINDPTFILYATRTHTTTRNSPDSYNRYDASRALSATVTSFAITKKCPQYDICSVPRDG